MRIAVVGTGIAGTTAVHLLARQHEVTVFEADERPGGHAHTVTVRVGGHELEADTGFLVYNPRTYPGLVRLLGELGVTTESSDMGFSVSDQSTGTEYGGRSLSTVFAQRRNAVNPRFLRMLVDIARFQRIGRRILISPNAGDQTLEDLLGVIKVSDEFVRWYLVPLGSSIWSADPATFVRMPALTVLRFFERHGLLAFGDKPEWRTITGGSSTYVAAALGPVAAAGRQHLSCPVQRIARTDLGIEIGSPLGTQRFDHVVVATHSDQALDVLVDASVAEKDVLGAIHFQQNLVTLHTDNHLMPRNTRAWAAWNYHRPSTPCGSVTMTYWLNRLQNLRLSTPVLITLNRDDEIDPELVLARFEYAHPVIDGHAVAAQARHAEVSGVNRVSFCGAYWGAGFHEDGLQSAVRVCRELGVTW